VEYKKVQTNRQRLSNNTKPICVAPLP